MNTTEVTSLEIVREFKASVDRVYRAWTEVSEMKQWMAPEGASVARLEADVKVGGKYLVEMATPNGPATAVGEYREVSPGKSLSYTWRWKEQDEMPDSLVEVTFAASSGGTKVTLRHTGFANEDSAKGHTAGWNSCFTVLEKHLT